MPLQVQKTETKRLVVEKDTESGTITLKREGGGPIFLLSAEEWRHIRVGYYDPS